jgi:hypothetical protein
MSATTSGSHPTINKSTAPDDHLVRLVGSAIAAAVIGVVLAGTVGAVLAIGVVIVGNVGLEAISWLHRRRDGTRSET